MSYRQPRKISNEEPHRRLDPREVKARASYRSSSDERGDTASRYQRSDRDRYDEFDLDEFITYDDHYDDVRGYNRSRREPDTGASRSRRVVGKILCFLQAAVSVFLLYMFFRLNILPGTTLAIVAIILIILWVLVFISQGRRRNKGQAVGMIISILLSFIMAVGSTFLIQTDNMIQTVTNNTYDIRTYDIAVKADDPAQTLEDVREYTFAVQPSYQGEELASIVEQIEQELGCEIRMTELPTAISMAQALLDGEVNAILYNDAFNSTIMEQIPEYETSARILRNFSLKSVTEVKKTVDVDIHNDSFLVFISGTDSEGQVSLTGRSDVDIVAGVNPNTHQVLLITVPRDYYVEFPGVTAPGARDKLTHAGIYGMDELLAVMGNLLGRDINYYIRVNFSSMMQIVDAIGGVTIYNEQSFISHGGYDFPEGYLDLDGEHALHYVRERFAFEDGDFARGRNQIKVIQAMMDKLISFNTLANYTALTNAVSNFAATSIPAGDITGLVRLQLEENPSWHVVTYQMLGEVMMQPCQSANGAYLSVDMPYVESIANVELLLTQLYGGEVLSEDLQLADNGQLTYVTAPVSR